MELDYQWKEDEDKLQFQDNFLLVFKSTLNQSLITVNFKN